MLTAVDLFAGAGGFSTGAAMAGVRRWVSNDQPCDAPPRGCNECAWGKVLGCWRCGGR